MKRILLIAMLVFALTDLTGRANLWLAGDLSGPPLAHAQTGGGPSASLGTGYDLTRWTVDGGGAMNAAGGAYMLGGTIGQPDADVMNGGVYTLVGGFWGGGVNQYKVYLPLMLRNAQ